MSDILTNTSRGLFARPHSLQSYKWLFGIDSNGDRDEWAAKYMYSRGIAPRVLEARGVKLLRSQDEWTLVPGATPFSTFEEFERRWTEANAPIGIPMFVYNNPRPSCIQLRPKEPFKKKSDEPLLDKKGNTQKDPLSGGILMKTDEIKFLNPRGAKRGNDVGDLPADVNPIAHGWLDDDTTPIIITEGVAKGDSILSAALWEDFRIVPVSVTGVTMGYIRTENNVGETIRELADTVSELPLWDRRVYLCWDADWRLKKMVRDSLIVTAELLIDAGAEVRIVDVPPIAGKATGIDDYLAARGASLMELLEAAEEMTVEMAKQETQAYEDSDFGRAQRLADELRSKQNFLWNGTDFKFPNLVWDGKRWVRDRSGSIKRLAADLAARDPETMLRARSARAINDAVKLAQSLAPDLTVLETDFDQDPNLLNTQNGVVDLTNGAQCGHSPADRMMKITGVPMDPGEMPVTMKFLKNAMLGDERAVEYIQVALGMSLYGAMYHELLHWWFGGAGVGKTTFLEVVAYIFGDYAAVVSDELVLGGGAENDKADLRGVRFGYGAEMETNTPLRGAGFKRIVSRAHLRGRGLFKDAIEFENGANCHFAVNDLPILLSRGEDIARRTRVLAWPKERTEKLDIMLKDKMLAEAPQILAWMVQGAVKFAKMGFQLPLSFSSHIENATNAYLNGADTFSEFIALHLSVEPQSNVESKSVYQRYTAWADQNRLKAMSKPALRDLLVDRGVLNRERPEKILHGTSLWCGVRLRVEKSGFAGGWSADEIRRAEQQLSIPGVPATLERVDAEDPNGENVASTAVVPDPVPALAEVASAASPSWADEKYADLDFE